MEKFLTNILIIFILFNSLSITNSIGNIDFKLFELDSNVNDIIWCGNNKESIILLTEMYSLYKSDNRGITWKKLNDILLLTGKEEVADGNEVNIISKIHLFEYKYYSINYTFRSEK